MTRGALVWSIRGSKTSYYFCSSALAWSLLPVSYSHPINMKGELFSHWDVFSPFVLTGVNQSERRLASHRGLAPRFALEKTHRKNSQLELVYMLQSQAFWKTENRRCFGFKNMVWKFCYVEWNFKEKTASLKGDGALQIISPCMYVYRK